MDRRTPIPPQPAGPLTRAPDGTFVYQRPGPRFRPALTWALTAAMVAVFFAQQSVGGFTARFAIDPLAVRDGEWWRIVTGTFLHANLLHLAANAYFGLSIGTRLERHIGTWRLLALTTASMAGAGIAIVWLGSGPAVGFSGVLFGWLASWLAFHLTPRFPHLHFSPAMRTAYVQTVALNLFISLLPGISWQGHAGGFVAGFCVAYVLGRQRKVLPERARAYRVMERGPARP